MVTFTTFFLLLTYLNDCLSSHLYEQQLEEFKMSNSNDNREIANLTSRCRKLQNEIESQKVLKIF